VRPATSEQGTARRRKALGLPVPSHHAHPPSPPLTLPPPHPPKGDLTFNPQTDALEAPGGKKVRGGGQEPGPSRTAPCLERAAPRRRRAAAVHPNAALPARPPPALFQPCPTHPHNPHPPPQVVLASPHGDELPAKGFDPGMDTYQAPPEPEARAGVKVGVCVGGSKRGRWAWERMRASTPAWTPTRRRPSLRRARAWGKHRLREGGRAHSTGAEPHRGRRAGTEHAQLAAQQQ
jgi:hypothetical protein